MKYKQKIKEIILRLPKGETVWFPAVQFVRKHVFHPFYTMKKEYDEKKEADYILKRMQADDFAEAILVYDAKVSPLTYGDFFNMVMLARYFSMVGKKAKLYILAGEYREDMLEAYGYSSAKSFINNLLELPHVLLSGEKEKISITVFDHFTEMMDACKNKPATIVVFRNEVFKRESVYKHYFNLINILISPDDIQMLDKFLLDRNDMGSIKNIQYPSKPYITWGARYSEKWAFYRNLDAGEMVHIHAELKKMFPDHDVMIVSDAKGCAYFREIAQKHHLPCLFSKDFSKTFMGDCALVVGSDYYFQLRGGGIGVAAMFSNVAHCIICTPGNEKVWQKKGITRWARKNQIWITGRTGLPL
ncbi:MAG: hypothetical protein K4571_03020 [Deltaproteobacteria bacterium]